MQGHADVLNRGLLREREVAHLLDGEVDVGPHLGRYLGDRGGDLRLRHHDVAAPAVELLRIVAHGGLAAGLDGGEHLGDDLLRGGGLGLGGLGGFLQVAGAHGGFLGSGWVAAAFSAAA
jgi:hypothetical protein